MKRATNFVVQLAKSRSACVVYSLRHELEGLRRVGTVRVLSVKLGRVPEQTISLRLVEIKNIWPICFPSLF